MTSYAVCQCGHDKRQHGWVSHGCRTIVSIELDGYGGSCPCSKYRPRQRREKLGGKK